MSIIGKTNLAVKRLNNLYSHKKKKKITGLEIILKWLCI